MFKIHMPSTGKQNEKNSSGLKSVFVKLRFRDALMWTVGLFVELKPPFQILRVSVDTACLRKQKRPGRILFSPARFSRRLDSRGFAFARVTVCES